MQSFSAGLGRRGVTWFGSQLGSLQRLGYPGRYLVRRQRRVSAEGARRRGGGSRSFARRMSDRGIDIVSPPEPVNSQQQHEHQGQYNRGLGNLGSRCCLAL